MTEEGTSGGAAPQEPAAQPPRPQQPQRPLSESVREFLGKAQAEPTGLLGAAVVVAVATIAAVLGWLPLSIPARFISALVPEMRCTGFEPGSIPMYGCSGVVGALVVAGPFVVVIALFVLRRPIAAAFRSLGARLPAEARFLVAPVAGTLAFAVAWAGVHYETADQAGLVPQTVFPAVVGLFLYAVQRWGNGIRKVLGPLLDLRDRYPIGYRLLAALAVPLVVSLIITFEDRVSQTALKEQVVAIIALACGYIALMPRTGPPLAGVERTLRELGAP